jgi:Alpha-glutamyl/putrescinyl thymine pyrophosphorylase clade 3
MNGPEKERRRKELEAQLIAFHKEQMPLTGIVPVENILAFVDQLIDSLQRVEYVHKVRARSISPLRTDPKSELFDPVRAAIFMAESEQREEAFWLVFLATHCGRNLRTEWLLARELYGAYEDKPWTWACVAADPAAYGEWLEDNRVFFAGKFGNHRKYESLKQGSRGTGVVVRTYVEWVKEHGSHAEMIVSALARAKGDPRRAFALLYGSMSSVMSFGRTGRFDYLTMLAKTGLAAIDANSTYMKEATGPKKGARLLFDGQIDSTTDARTLEARVAALEKHLGVGMQVMEDAMCNWQKSPGKYVAFRG